MKLDFNKPMTTRMGSKIRIYWVYPDKLHGAYLVEDDWIPCSWTLPNGFYHNEPKLRGSSLDLINNEPYEETAA
jgi:hypothetical protein